MGFYFRWVKALDPFLITCFRWVEAFDPFLITCFRRVEALDPFLINNSDVIVVNNLFLITYFRRVEALDPFLINNSDAIVVINPFLINNSDVIVVNNPFVINNSGVVVVINPKRIEGRRCLVAPQKQCARDLLWDGVPIALSGRAGSSPPSQRPTTMPTMAERGMGPRWRESMATAALSERIQ